MLGKQLKSFSSKKVLLEIAGNNVFLHLLPMRIGDNKDNTSNEFRKANAVFSSPEISGWKAMGNNSVVKGMHLC